MVLQIGSFVCPFRKGQIVERVRKYDNVHEFPEMVLGAVFTVEDCRPNAVKLEGVRGWFDVRSFSVLVRD